MQCSTVYSNCRVVEHCVERTACTADVGGGAGVAGQYSMHVQMTPSDAVVMGGRLEVACDIWNWEPARGVFVVWLRRAHGTELELGTNENVAERLRDRYSARKELRRPADFTHVSYYLTITGAKRTHAALLECSYSAYIYTSTVQYNRNEIEHRRKTAESKVTALYNFVV